MCEVDECDRIVHAGGFCSKHYTRFKRHGDPTVIKVQQRKYCKVPSCDDPCKGQGYCNRHYIRLLRYGDPLKTLRSDSWGSGRYLDNHDGYWRVRVSPEDPFYCMANSHTGYVLEQRYVVAKSIGRPLLSSETVHHINGDRQDNSLGNLQLRQGRHGKGVVRQCQDCGSHNVLDVALPDAQQELQ